MGLKLKGLVLVLAMGGVSLVRAETNEGVYDPQKYYSISSVSVSEIKKETLMSPEYADELYEKDFQVQNVPGDPIERVGRVISIARDLVALGEDIYRLVIKGKPTNVTSYAPISVVPRVNGEIVDILDTERWTAPVKRTYQVVYKNLYSVEVVVFRYSVLYSYNGSYNGKGAYLAAVQIIPESVKTLFGFDFTATMKLGGIVNQGTKADPVAAATLLMEYTISSVMNAYNKVDTFFVTGRGGFKRY
jgi:hypothetical protein